METNLNFVFVGKKLRYSDRDILKVKLLNGEIQPFYRSSGRNSGMPGVWLPFDGIAIIPYLWFDKERFCHKDLREKGLDRYGTLELKQISKILGELQISPAKIEIKSARLVNFYLHTARSLLHNKNAKYFDKR